jgi:hypothetical protein
VTHSAFFNTRAGVVALNPKNGVKLRLAARIRIAVPRLLLVVTFSMVFVPLAWVGSACTRTLKKLALLPQRPRPQLIRSHLQETVRENQSFAPLGLVWFPLFPTACAVGCIFTPLRG